MFLLTSSQDLTIRGGEIIAPVFLSAWTLEGGLAAVIEEPQPSYRTLTYESRS
jgi:hypothetical protein